MNRLNVIIMTYTHSVMLSVSETPSAGRPLSGTLRVPPLPLQRESILPEGWFTAEIYYRNIESAGFAFPGDHSQVCSG